MNRGWPRSNGTHAGVSFLRSLGKWERNSCVESYNSAEGRFEGMTAVADLPWRPRSLDLSIPAFGRADEMVSNQLVLPEEDPPMSQSHTSFGPPAETSERGATLATF